MFPSVRFLLLCLYVLFSFTVSAFSDSIGIGSKNGLKYILHRVDKSQGLYAISKRYNIPVKDIQKANGDSLDNIHVNQIIFVPLLISTKQKIEITHQVAKGETIYKISKKYNVSVEDIITWNNILNKPIHEGDKLKIIQEVGVKKGPDQKNKPAPQKEAYANTYQSNSSNTELVALNEEGVATWLDNTTIGASKSLALHRDAPIGTIIQVTSVLNKKTVYVKVVGNLPKDDQKLKPIIEITKYSAKQLGIRDKFFLVKLAYHKKIEPQVGE